MFENVRVDVAELEKAFINHLGKFQCHLSWWKHTTLLKKDFVSKALYLGINSRYQPPQKRHYIRFAASCTYNFT